MPGDGLLLPLVVVLLLIVGLCIGGYMWWRARTDAPADVVAQRLPAQTPGLYEPLQVTLYYPWSGMLASVTARVTRQPDTQAQAREALAALFAEQHAKETLVLKDLRLRAVFVDATGMAYVDLTAADQRDVRASAWEELLSLYAIVNTLTQNFEEIKQVRFLVDGKEAQTLAGHIELARKFGKRTDLVRQ